MGLFDWLKTGVKEETPPSTCTDLVLATPDPEPDYTDVFEVRNPKYNDYEVVHFPYSKYYQYYPRHVSGKWFYVTHLGEIIHFSSPESCASFKTEAEAWTFIDLVIEQEKNGFSRVIKR